MGSFVSLLPQAPRENFAQAFQQGEQSAANLAATRQQTENQRTLLPEQAKAMHLENQQRQTQLDANDALNKAWQAGWGPSPTAAPTPPAAPPATPLASVASPEPANAIAGHNTLGDAMNQEATGGPSATAGLESDAPNAPAGGPTLAAAAGPKATARAASPMASHVAGTPLPSFDFNRVLDTLVRSGHGSLAPGQMAAHTEMLTKQATLLKDQTQQHRDMAIQATQLLQGIPTIHGSTPEETQQLRDAAYQRILPQFAAIEQKMDPNSQVPPHWDDQVGPQMIANGTSVADFNSRQHQVADLALKAKQELPKTVAEAKAQVQQDIGGVNSDQQYTDVLKKYRALADNEKRLDPNGVSVYQSALSTFPEQWSPAVSLDAQVSQLKPEERVKFFQGRLEMTSQRLAAAAQQGQAAYGAELARTDPTEAVLFPPAGAQQFDPDAVSRAAAQVGMTGAQRVTAENTMQYREDLLGIRQQLADITAKKAQRETPTEHKTAIEELKNKVWTDTAAMIAGQGKTATPADAVAFLRDPQRWGDNPDVSAHRMELIQEFQKSNAADLNASNISARTAKTQSAGKLPVLRVVNGKAMLVDPGTGQPATPGTPPSPAQPAAKPAAPPSAKPAPASTRSAPPQTVTDQLSPGEHTFRNGQTWKKNADGSMTYLRG